jgi:hypothetical protein
MASSFDCHALVGYVSVIANDLELQPLLYPLTIYILNFQRYYQDISSRRGFYSFLILRKLSCLEIDVPLSPDKAIVALWQ